MSETRTGFIYENVLANMADGVMTLDLEGRIITFNTSAGRMLGLDPAAVVGRSYAELFFEEEGLDEFNELVLRAIYESKTTHSEEVMVAVGGEERRLLASTTFLRSSTTTEAEKLGVIAVFSDVTERHNRQRIERLFGAYVAPRIVERMVGRDDRVAGVRQVMTVLFCDMQGFTTAVERLSAEQLVKFVNLYLSAMSEPVARHNGVIDKYIGDMVLAFWGPPFTGVDDHALLACQVALEQRQQLDRLRQQVREEIGDVIDAAAIEIRCGIATGEVVAGSIGSHHLLNYTLVGDTVNVAARLEAAGKEFGARILVSENTRESAQGRFAFREVGDVALRGRARPERVFELLGQADSAGSQ